MAKRYYWLKLPDGFFRQKAIKKLRKIAVLRALVLRECDD